MTNSVAIKDKWLKYVLCLEYVFDMGFFQLGQDD